MLGMSLKICEQEYARIIESIKPAEVPDNLKLTWNLLNTQFNLVNKDISHEEFCNFCLIHIMEFNALSYIHELLYVVSVVKAILEMPEVYEYCFTQLFLKDEEFEAKELPDDLRAKLKSSSKELSRDDFELLNIFCQHHFAGHQFIAAIINHLELALGVEVNAVADLAPARPKMDRAQKMPRPSSAPMPMLKNTFILPSIPEETEVDIPTY